MLAIRENKRPLEAALAHCPEDELTLWKEDLCSLAIELAKRFHGAQNSEDLQRGLNDAINLCSMGLLRGTGEHSVSSWAQLLREKGIRGLAQEITALTKQLEEKGDARFTDETSAPAAKTLQNILGTAEISTAQKALSFLEHMVSRRREELDEQALCSYLAHTNGGKRGGRILLESDVASAMVTQDFLLCVIPRCIGIPEGDIQRSEAKRYHSKNNTPSDIIRISKREWEKAEHIYKKWRDGLPNNWGELLHKRDTPNGDWFTVHIRKKRIPQKKREA